VTFARRMGSRCFSTTSRLKNLNFGFRSFKLLVAIKNFTPKLEIFTYIKSRRIKIKADIEK
jgi:hypothetical protein